MAESYWRPLIARAWAETRAKARIDTLSNLAFVIVPVVTGAAIVAAATRNVPWSAVGAVGGLAVAVLVHFVVRIAALPATLATEMREKHQAELEEIARQRDEKQMLLAAIMPGQDESEKERRTLIVRQLVPLYMEGHDGISSAMRAGLELPPEKWMNHELAHRGYHWTVRDSGNGRFETCDV